MNELNHQPEEALLGLDGNGNRTNRSSNGFTANQEQTHEPQNPLETPASVIDRSPERINYERAIKLYDQVSAITVRKIQEGVEKRSEKRTGGIHYPGRP